VTYREFDEALNAASEEIKTASAADKRHYVPAPPGPTQCPICLDDFKPTWSAEANDFVFLDAVEVNRKIYHVSCWEEVNGGPYVPTPGTPNSNVSSKRKAATQEWDASKRLHWG
jgi:pre-mRNA cleavage complex 2 protein Pcf11